MLAIFRKAIQAGGFQSSFHALFQKIQGYPLNFVRERACFQHFPQMLRKQSKVFSSFRFGNALFHNLFCQGRQLWRSILKRSHGEFHAALIAPAAFNEEMKWVFRILSRMTWMNVEK
jgi:hypothetical protein